MASVCHGKIMLEWHRCCEQHQQSSESQGYRKILKLPKLARHRSDRPNISYLLRFIQYLASQVFSLTSSSPAGNVGKKTLNLRMDIRPRPFLIQPTLVPGQDHAGYTWFLCISRQYSISPATSSLATRLRMSHISICRRGLAREYRGLWLDFGRCLFGTYQSIFGFPIAAQRFYLQTFYALFHTLGLHEESSNWSTWNLLLMDGRESFRNWWFTVAVWNDSSEAVPRSSVCPVNHRYERARASGTFVWI